MATRDELIIDLAKGVLSTEDLAKLDWEFVSVVVDVEEGSVSNSGYAYVGDEAIPIAVAEYSFDQIVQNLHKEIQEPGRDAFLQMLIQLRREDLKLKVDFEYENPARWSITAQNYATMGETLKPDFSEE